MNSEEVTKRILEIREIFMSKGLVPEGYYTQNCPKLKSLVYTPTRKRTYLGTYLNEFSLSTRERYPESPLLWSDAYALEEAEVEVSSVYRHNGTEKNVSIQIVVSFQHSTVKKMTITQRDLERWNGKHREIIKNESPTDYIARGYYLSPFTYGSSTRIKKFRADASDRVVNNAIEKAMETLKTFVPRDHSEYEQNPADYHADTTEEYQAYCRKQRGL